MAKYAYHRTDTNQDEIVEALKARGVTVCRVGTPVDLLCGFQGRNYLLEVKTAKGTLEASQRRFMCRWGGHVVVVRSVADALAALGL